MSLQFHTPRVRHLTFSQRHTFSVLWVTALSFCLIRWPLIRTMVLTLIKKVKIKLSCKSFKQICLKKKMTQFLKFSAHLPSAQAIHHHLKLKIKSMLAKKSKSICQLKTDLLDNIHKRLPQENLKPARQMTMKRLQTNKTSIQMMIDQRLFWITKKTNKTISLMRSQT